MDSQEYTEKKLKSLEKKLTKEYGTASRELQQKWLDYLFGWNEQSSGKMIHHAGFIERHQTEFQAYVLDGAYTDEQFRNWCVAQMGREQYFIDLRSQMVERVVQTNAIAEGYINGTLPSVYCRSNNEVCKIAQKSAMDQGIVGIRFDLVDEHTVKNLMMEKNNVIKFKVVNVDRVRDYQWNDKQIQHSLTQGILQGESIPQIAKRFENVMQINGDLEKEIMKIKDDAIRNQALEKVLKRNRQSAIRNARTAVTSAQNCGKQDRWEDLADQGCEVTKYWSDTHDSIPPEREAHWEAGETYDEAHSIPYDEPFIVGGEELMYPCDPRGSGWNIYNCRCQMATGKIRFRSTMSDETRKFANIRIR